MNSLMKGIVFTIEQGPYLKNLELEIYISYMKYMKCILFPKVHFQEISQLRKSLAKHLCLESEADETFPTLKEKPTSLL